MDHFSLNVISLGVGRRRVCKFATVADFLQSAIFPGPANGRSFQISCSVCHRVQPGQLAWSAFPVCSLGTSHGASDRPNNRAERSKLATQLRNSQETHKRSDGTSGRAKARPFTCCTQWHNRPRTECVAVSGVGATATNDPICANIRDTCRPDPIPVSMQLIHDGHTHARTHACTHAYTTSKHCQQHQDAGL